MRKFGIILLGALLIGVFNAQATENSESETKNKNEVTTTLDTTTELETIVVAAQVPKGLKAAVTDQLLYPEFAQHKSIEGQVYMRLTVDQNNKIKIVGLNATSPYLGDYVSEQLAEVHVKNPGCKPGQVYMMKINFDLDS